MTGSDQIVERRDDEIRSASHPLTGPRVVAIAPGRVNLIGDHTDYTGGLVMPMAVDLVTTITGTRGGDWVHLSSEQEAVAARVPLTVEDANAATPAWARYIAGVVAVLHPSVGFSGHVSSTVPYASGLSSSAALEVALALALGFSGSPLELAQLCQRAENLGSGVPSGIMDQLASAAGIEGHALLIDCFTFEVTPCPLPDGEVEVIVIHSGQERTLWGSAYAERTIQCAQAEQAIGGPLRTASISEVDGIPDPIVRARAMHVVTENARVRSFAAALQAGEWRAAGALMVESHQSLRNDYEVSTPALDQLVSSLMVAPGVHGARLTGAGFGGCVVALCEPDALDPESFDRAWRVRPSAGARLV